MVDVKLRSSRCFTTIRAAFTAFNGAVHALHNPPGIYRLTPRLNFQELDESLDAEALRAAFYAYEAAYQRSIQSWKRAHSVSSVWTGIEIDPERLRLKLRCPEWEPPADDDLPVPSSVAVSLNVTHLSVICGTEESYDVQQVLSVVEAPRAETALTFVTRRAWEKSQDSSS